jgi:pyruvate formate lyase activating enzyme
MIVRTPVIPGVNDTEEEIEQMCRLLSRLGGNIRYELLGFHTLGFGKYVDLGMDNPMAGARDLEQTRLDELRQILKKCGF